MRSRFYILRCVSLFLAVNVAFNLLISGTIWARFHTVAGPAEPNKIGQLLMTFTGVEGKPEEKEFSVYYPGPNPKIPDPVLVGRTGQVADLPIGAYDVEVPVHPALWLRDVVIEEGKTTALNVGGYGRILINEKNSDNKPLEQSFYVYTRDGKRELVINGTSNKPSEYVLAGAYDIEVDSDPRVFLEAVEITAGRDKVIDMPQTGRLDVRGENALGEPLRVYVFSIYKPGERMFPAAESYVNSPKEFQPGTYDIKVDLEPAVWYEAVEIKSGEKKVIDLPKLGRLEVRGKDAAGELLSGYRFYVYLQGKREEAVAIGDVNIPKNLLPGTYDIMANTEPKGVWFEGIKIKAGGSEVIDLPAPGALIAEGKEAPAEQPAADIPGGQGRIEVLGKDALSQPFGLDVDFYVYPAGEKKRQAAYGKVKEPLNLPPGTYDIRVDFLPDIWFESVEIIAGQSKAVELPPLGRLDVKGKNALGEEYDGTFYFTVYERGEREKPIKRRYVNYYKDLPPRTYDVMVNLNPEALYEGVEITAGKSTVIELPPPGRLEIWGTNAEGGPTSIPFTVYARGEREKPVTESYVNIPIEIQPGVYDIKVALESGEVWFDAVEIISRQSKVIELPPPGRLLVFGNDAAGKPLAASFTVYTGGERGKKATVRQVNETVDLPPGIYDVRVDLAPEAWYEGVKIAGGQLTAIDLSRPKTQEIPAKEVVPKEKVVKEEPPAAGPAGPHGSIEIRGNDAAGKPLSVGFYVYKHGDREKIIESGTINIVKGLPPDTYDIMVNLTPEIWYDGVEIAEGHAKVIDLPQTGRLVVQGKDAAGESPMIGFRVYASGDREKIIASGNTWTIAQRTEELPPGTYDIEVESKPPVWYEGVGIAVGHTKVVDLPQTGRLMVQAKDTVGFKVHPSGNREKYIAHGDTGSIAAMTVELPPGTYNIKVEFDALTFVWYEGIGISTGQHTNVTVMDPSQTGSLVVKGLSMTAFDVYAGGDRSKHIAHGNTWAAEEDTVELQPGTYDVRINSTPETWYEGIEITAGHTNVIDLPQTK